MTQWIIIGLVAVVMILIVLFATGSFAKSQITSATAKTQGCDSPTIPVVVTGSAFSKDSAFWGVTAEPQRIDVSGVTANGNTLGILSSDYTWKVTLLDAFTGNEVTSDSGKNNHPGGGVLIEDKYKLTFLVPDNNCDSVIDNFEGQLQYRVTDEGGNVKTISKPISFQNGRYVR